MKIVIRPIYERGNVYVISRLDNSDFDWIVMGMGGEKFYNEEGEPIHEDWITLQATCQPETWDGEKFIETFNRMKLCEYVAEKRY